MPHHLLDVWDVPGPANVADYQRLVRARSTTWRRGRLAVLVGGSGLYVRAALDDLDLPRHRPDGAGPAGGRAGRLGPAALHARLRRGGPGAAAAILPSNGRRVVRALEVVEMTGGPFTASPARAGRLRGARGPARAGRWTAPSSTGGSRRGSTGCGQGVWSTRCAGSPTGAARGPHGLPGARLRAGAALPGRGVDRGTRPATRRSGHPAVRPPAGVVVPPRPADGVAGRRRSPDLVVLERPRPRRWLAARGSSRN